MGIFVDPKKADQTSDPATVSATEAAALKKKDIEDPNQKAAEKKVPIMAHPPIEKSSLSLELFLNTVKEHNEKNSNNTKAVKLDIKTIETVIASVQMLEKDWEKVYVC